MTLARGAPGLPGAKGEPGERGYRGENGAKGDVGAPGRLPRATRKSVERKARDKRRETIASGLSPFGRNVGLLERASGQSSPAVFAFSRPSRLRSRAIPLRAFARKTTALIRSTLFSRLLAIIAFREEGFRSR